MIKEKNICNCANDDNIDNDDNDLYDDNVDNNDDHDNDNDDNEADDDNDYDDDNEFNDTYIISLVQLVIKLNSNQDVLSFAKMVIYSSIVAQVQNL